ncbi:hypothetical protein FRX31_007388, partial [Thalictrum thalictroides]
PNEVSQMDIDPHGSEDRQLSGSRQPNDQGTTSTTRENVQFGENAHPNVNAQGSTRSTRKNAQTDTTSAHTQNKKAKKNASATKTQGQTTKKNASATKTQTEKTKKNATVDRQANQAKKNSSAAVPRVIHERVPEGVGAYSSESGYTFIRLPGMKRGYWYKPGDCGGPAPAIRQTIGNQVQHDSDGPPATQPSQPSPHTFQIRSSCHAGSSSNAAPAPRQPFAPLAPRQPFVLPRPSASSRPGLTAPTLSSLAKTVPQLNQQSLEARKAKARDWLNTQTFDF